jgi:hypothetical protein
MPHDLSFSAMSRPPGAMSRRFPPCLPSSFNNSTGESARAPFPQALQKDCSLIFLALKADYRKGPTGRLKSKVESVKEKLK